MGESFLYEPIDVLKVVADDVWLVDGPVEKMSIGPASMPFPTRMVVIRLPGGELFVWSPTALDAGLRKQIDALGRVRHLVSPNRIHYAHIAAWKRAYPDALAWASPGVRERAASQRIDVSFDRDLGDAADPAWARDVDQLVFRGSPALEEVVFFHRASRTLVLADLIENFERSRIPIAVRVLAQLGGVLDPDGKAPLDLRATFLGHRDVARACFERMLAWEPERVIMAHGRWYERDGARELRRAFRWLGTARPGGRSPTSPAG